MKAIALIRVSTEEQARDSRAGIDRQREAICLAAQRHGLNIVRWVIVKESGKYILGDPQFQQIFCDLAAGVIDGVIVAEQSRIFRPTEWDDFAVLGHFKRNHKMIWTPTAAIDPCTTEGMLLLGVTGLISGIELKTMQDRMLGARDALRAQGFHGSAPHTLPSRTSTRRASRSITRWATATTILLSQPGRATRASASMLTSSSTR